jgi:hypothetical protein
MVSAREVFHTKVGVMRALAACFASVMLALTSYASPQYMAVDLAAFDGQLVPRGGAFDDFSGPAQAAGLGGQAYLWHGSAASVITLTPAGSAGATVYGAFSTKVSVPFSRLFRPPFLDPFLDQQR